MHWIKKYSRWMLVLPVVIWFVYILVNMSDFQAVDNLSKNVALSEVIQENDTFIERSGEFQARQYRIHTFEVRFKQKIKPDRIEVILSNKDGKVVSSVNFEPLEELKRHRIEHEIYIKRSEIYTVSIRVYAEQADFLTTCKVHYNAFLKLDYIAAVCVSFLAVVILVLDVIKKKRSSRSTKRVNGGICLGILLQSGAAFWTVEYMFRNDILVNIAPKMIGVNWMLYLAVYLLAYFLLNSLKWSVLLCNSLFTVWGLANQYVYLFKGQALMPVDLKSLRTAANVAAEYDYTLTPEMRLALSVMILCSVLWLCTQDRKLVCDSVAIKRILIRVPGILLGVLMGYVLFVSAFIPGLRMTLDMWNSRSSYHLNGTVPAFLGYWHLMQVDKPEGYSDEAVLKLTETVELKNVESNDIRPNIVVVMNETFVDLSEYGEFETNVPYMEHYDSIIENSINGQALVNIIGGGTANSEYEYLTGHSLAFMSSSIPYVQHIQEEHSSMASNLSAQGYDTTAIHPYDGVNWRRNAIYPYLGFDEFISLENMDKENAEYVRQFISDEYTYEMIMDILQQDSETPDFIFDVTVQNHSGYIYEKDDFQEKVKVKGYDSAEVNQYLSLIKISDEALGKLVRQLEGFEEPTILVFFGDHYPRLPEEFFNWINQENAAPSLETLQKKYSVPYFIWANYDIEEEQDSMTSLNYLGARTLELAGVEMSEYDRYRLKMAEDIPAVNAFGYVDDRGQYCNTQDDSEKYNQLQQYWTLIYNELFDTKNSLKSFFGIENKESQ